MFGERKPPHLIAVQPHFDVVAESDDWLVVDKAAPLVVHPAGRKDEPTLLGGVEQLLSYEMAAGARLSMINRLDRETSGLVLIAKNPEWAGHLGRAMEAKRFQKSYLAIITGCPDWDEMRCDLPILRAGEVESTRIYIRRCVHENGLACETHFEVLERKRNRGQAVSLIRATPITGRTHQIRVHLAHLGFPIVGDKIYAGDGQAYLEFVSKGHDSPLVKKLPLPRHALHAERLSLESEILTAHWSCPLALDLAEFWGVWSGI